MRRRAHAGEKLLFGEADHLLLGELIDFRLGGRRRAQQSKKTDRRRRRQEWSCQSRLRSFARG
jgi:hypothetical protein